MNTPIKILLVLLVLIGGGLAYFLIQGNQPTEIVNTDPAASDPDEKPVTAVTPKRGGNEGGEARVATTEPERVKTAASSTASGTEYAQGITGVLVDPFDRPVQGAKLFLMPGLGFESLRMFEMYQKGTRFPPLAATETGPDGRYRLGVKDWVDKKQYEIRILHDDYCDANISGIRPQPNDWADNGSTKLKTGATIFGRVTNENGLPVPEARVTIKDGSGSLNITPAPGREDGNFAITSASGDYELRNLDTALIYRVIVAAKNFANEEKTDLNLKTESRHQIDFQLAVGLDIAGSIVNPQGKPIRNAKVTVAALSQKSQQTEVTHTNKEGQFLASGLKAGVFAVMVEAEGYLNADEKPIQAGETDLTITLEQTGRVQLTVLDKNGAALPTFHCNLKAAFEGQDTYGNPLIQKSVKGATNGTVEITGVKPMTYVAEVFAKGHAKNFSQRFTIAEGQAAVPKITVQLNEGGVIQGFLRDPAGNPISGVLIKTMPNGMVENPFTRMFQVAYTITNQTAKSDSKGMFRFNQLYTGKYQLKFDHIEYCSTVIKDLEVKNGEVTDLGDVTMEVGCMVSGIAFVSGSAKGQVRVNISSVQDPKNPTAPFSCEAITDNEGKFLLTKRLPPGDYEVMAAENVQANPLIMMVQFNKSKKKFTVPSGVQEHALDVRLESIK